MSGAAVRDGAQGVRNRVSSEEYLPRRPVPKAAAPRAAALEVIDLAESSSNDEAETSTEKPASAKRLSGDATAKTPPRKRPRVLASDSEGGSETSTPSSRSSPALEDPVAAVAPPVELSPGEDRNDEEPGLEDEADTAEDQWLRQTGESVQVDVPEEGTEEDAMEAEAGEEREEAKEELDAGEEGDDGGSEAAVEFGLDDDGEETQPESPEADAAADEEWNPDFEDDDEGAAKGRRRLKRGPQTNSGPARSTRARGAVEDLVTPLEEDPLEEMRRARRRARVRPVRPPDSDSDSDAAYSSRQEWRRGPGPKNATEAMKVERERQIEVGYERDAGEDAEHKQHAAAMDIDPSDPDAEHLPRSGEKLLLNPKEGTATPADGVAVNDFLRDALRPHQVAGLRFMFDHVIGTLKKLRAGGEGFGCVLAHNMGLGKTLQVVTLVYTLASSDLVRQAAMAGARARRAKEEDETEGKAKEELYAKTEAAKELPPVSETGRLDRVLVVTPASTVDNWRNELERWEPPGVAYNTWLGRCVPLRTSMSLPDRHQAIKRWHRDGGVLIVGYKMFSSLAGKDPADGKAAGAKEPKKKGKSRKRRSAWKELVCPGADIVICDEGHRFKTMNATQLQSLRKVRTRRRLLLTGTPVQNNLMEYYAMVSFVRQGLLGTQNQFKYRFAEPIKDGLATDASDRMVRRSKERQAVLFRTLQPCVHRRTAKVLLQSLPPKHEYILNVRMSPPQRRLYVKCLLSDQRGNGLFAMYQTLQQIWNHPKVLHINDRRREKASGYNSIDEFIDDGEDEDDYANESDTSGAAGRPAGAEIDDQEERKEPAKPERNWDKIKELEQDVLSDFSPTLSGKLCVCLEIIRLSRELGESILVFSQSLAMLDVLEHALWRLFHMHVGQDLLRLDGSTAVDSRQKLIEGFNDRRGRRRHGTSKTGKVLLLSLGAGGVGINLTAATRVILFDSAWNPASDTQAVFRAYRYGQTREVHVYRLLAYGTMEDKIFARQTAKRQLASGVCDDEQLLRQFSADDLRKLYSLDDGLPLDEDLPADEVLQAEFDGFLDDVRTGRGTEQVRLAQAVASVAESAANAAGELVSPSKGAGPGESPMKGASAPGLGGPRPTAAPAAKPEAAGFDAAGSDALGDRTAAAAALDKEKEATSDAIKDKVLLGALTRFKTTVEKVTAHESLLQEDDVELSDEQLNAAISAYEEEVRLEAVPRAPPVAMPTAPMYAAGAGYASTPEGAQDAQLMQRLVANFGYVPEAVRAAGIQQGVDFLRNRLRHGSLQERVQFVDSFPRLMTQQYQAMVAQNQGRGPAAAPVDAQLQAAPGAPANR